MGQIGDSSGDRLRRDEVVLLSASCALTGGPAGRGRMTNAQIHPIPNEILRQPDGFLRITVRVHEWLDPSLGSSGGCRAGRYVSMNVCGDWMQMLSGEFWRARSKRSRLFVSLCGRRAFKAQTIRRCAARKLILAGFVSLAGCAANPAGEDGESGQW